MAIVTVSTSPYVLAAGQTLSATNDYAVLLQAPGPTAAPQPITIGGAVTVTSTGFATVAAIRIGDGNFYVTTLTLQAGGSLRVTATGFGTAMGLAGGSWMPVTTFGGSVDVSARAEAFGVYAGLTHAGDDTAFTNTGHIRASSTEDHAQGVYMAVADGFANSGVIEATGVQATGVRFYQWNAAFQNSGVIRATATGAGEQSYALYANATFRSPVVNTGTLEGDYAIKFVDYHGPNPGNPWQLSPTVFDNRGTMNGKVDLGALEQVLQNSGSIRGEVLLGAGNDTYSGAAGSVVGMVSGGDGNDSLVGGAAFDSLQGNMGADTETGGLGDDWVVGGKDNDVLYGNEGGDIVYGNIGADTCDGGEGADTIRGGQDSDILLGGAGNDWLSGDRGADDITGGAGADIFHTFGDAGTDRVTDFNALEGDRVMLDPGTQYTATQVEGNVIISMTGGGQMVLVGVQLSSLPAGWIFEG